MSERKTEVENQNAIHHIDEQELLWNKAQVNNAVLKQWVSPALSLRGMQAHLYITSGNLTLAAPKCNKSLPLRSLTCLTLIQLHNSEAAKEKLAF